MPKGISLKDENQILKSQIAVLEKTIEVSWKKAQLIVDELHAEIAGRKDAEEALKASRLQLIEAMDLARIVYWDFNPSSRMLEVNDAFYKLNGTTAKIEGGYHILMEEYARKFIHPDDLHLFYQHKERMDSNPDMDNPQDLEHRIVRRDGKVRYIINRTRIVRDTEGRVIRIFGANQDITEQKKIEDDLLRERNQLKTLLSFYRQPDMQIRDIISFIVEECIRMTESRLGFFGFINKDETMMTAHLWSEEAMKGCAIDFKPVEFSLTHSGIWAEAIRKHEPLIINDYMKPDPRKKGYPEGHVPVQRLMSIPIIKGNKAVAIVAVANKKTDYEETDILYLSVFIESIWDAFRRNKAEEEIRRLNEELELKIKERTNQLIEAQEELVRKEKLAILGQLAGIVGHEIRNPMGVISNAVYFLKTLMPDANDTVKEYLDIIKQEIGNSLRIITDLLDFARTTSSKAQPVAFAALMNQGIKKCLIPENIAVDIEIPETLPTLLVDPAQIEQVFQNLITNAIQAMPNGGALNISARRAQGARRKAQDYEEKNNKQETLNSQGEIGSYSEFVEITVSDTGGGISPENMKKLFHPLFTTKTQGIGLGLVVCKNLVESNGGRIKVESQIGKGTIFIVRLPMVKEDS